MKAATPVHTAGGIVLDISIHAAREGGDDAAVTAYHLRFSFQSTPPVKAATKHNLAGGGEEHISIHAAREGGDTLHRFIVFMLPQISIHAAREGGDTHRMNRGCRIRYFNPRRP